MATKKSVSFEKNIEKLSDIVEKMEDETLDIDKSIALYKQGITLSLELSNSLKQYEDEIYELKQGTEGLFIDKTTNEHLQF